MRWRILLGVILLLVLGYGAAWIVTERQRESVTARLRALAEDARTTHDMALANWASDSREVVSVTDVHELLGPFGDSLESDTSWGHFVNDIGFDGRWERGDLEEARAWLDEHEALLVQARDIADRRLVMGSDGPLRSQALPLRMLANCGRSLAFCR